ncbi:acyltransferase family protein [Micrococcaceae bacterium Sec5.7]
MTVVHGLPAIQFREESGREYSLDILRILSISGVVAIHIFGYVVGHAKPDTKTWWIAAGLDIPFIWVVPVFVMISGALVLAPRAGASKPGNFYRKRAVRLIPALVAWHVIYLAGVRFLMRGEDLTFARTFQLLTDGSVFTQLYFLWLILGLYAVSPLLSAFIHAGSRRRAQVLATVLLGLTALVFMVPGIAGALGLSRPVALNIFTQWMPYAGYFVAGWALKGIRLKGLALAGTVVAVFGLAALCTWQYGHRGRTGILDVVAPVSYVSVTVMALSIAVFVAGNSVFSRVRPSPDAGRFLIAVSNASFGVFLVHMLIFEAIRLNFASVSGGQSLVPAAVTYVSTLILSFAVSMIASRMPYARAIF